MGAENIARVYGPPSLVDKETFFVVYIEIFFFNHHFLKLDDFFEIERNILIDIIARKY